MINLDDKLAEIRNKLVSGEKLTSREKRYLVKYYEIECNSISYSWDGSFSYVTSLLLCNEKYYMLRWKKGRYLNEGTNEYCWDPIEVFPEKVVIATTYGFKSKYGEYEYTSTPFVRTIKKTHFDTFPLDK